MLKSESYSPDNLINIERLERQGVVTLSYIDSPSDFPQVSKSGVVVDSLFGSGLTRPLSGVAEQLVDYLNEQETDRLAIDIPSGLFSENNPCPNQNTIFRAAVTIAIQFPRLSFFFPENDQYVGQWNVVDIGLHPQAIREVSSPYFLVDEQYVFENLSHRNKFDHKGLRGHCLIIAGCHGMYGAAIISAKSCLNAGAGLVSVHVPQNGLSIVQQALPEVIVGIDTDKHYFTNANLDKKYNA
ncbi:MAG TPA: bifunctional ADP-dependent NAD(P)H-hydrate dehydratase/NAD(P)H-hydrate epimerase, partial [Bacteroidales bacterium]|nr:bifunctional ADP-dependent NAD(P)H-hydrate dehydratase/NAD(P)H-hydrate epimerase [Bacteroidales bacterium]